MATYDVNTKKDSDGDITEATVTIKFNQLEVDILLDNYPTLQEAVETLSERFAFERAKRYTLHRAQDEYARQRKAGNTAELPDYFDDEDVMDWWLNSEYYPGTAAEREEI